MTSVSDSSVGVHLVQLFRGYDSHRAWFWPAVVLLRRLSFVLASVFLGQQPPDPLRFLAFLLLHFASLQVHVRVRPYADGGWLNRTLHVLLLLLSSLFVATTPPYSDAVQIMALLLTVPPAVAFSLFALQPQITVCLRSVTARRNQNRRVDPPLTSLLLQLHQPRSRLVALRTTEWYRWLA